jgi:nitrogen regulatory protein PII
MKRIDAIIRHETLENVRERLINIGVEGLTVADVVGFGRQRATPIVSEGANSESIFIRNCFSRLSREMSRWRKS